MMNDLSSKHIYAILGTCLFCHQEGVMKVSSSKRHLAGMVFREHRCPGCGNTMISVQMLMDPLKMLEMGISPLLSYVTTHARRATPARNEDAAAG